MILREEDWEAYVLSCMQVGGIFVTVLPNTFRLELMVRLRVIFFSNKLCLTEYLTSGPSLTSKYAWRRTLLSLLIDLNSGLGCTSLTVISSNRILLTGSSGTPSSCPKILAAVGLIIEFALSLAPPGALPGVPLGIPVYTHLFFSSCYSWKTRSKFYISSARPGTETTGC